MYYFVLYIFHNLLSSGGGRVRVTLWFVTIWILYRSERGHESLGVKSSGLNLICGRCQWSATQTVWNVEAGTPIQARWPTYYLKLNNVTLLWSSEQCCVLSAFSGDLLCGSFTSLITRSFRILYYWNMWAAELFSITTHYGMRLFKAQLVVQNTLPKQLVKQKVLLLRKALSTSFVCLSMSVYRVR